MKGKIELYSAFNILMKEKDFYDITITEIVKTADVNRNTFYYHFNDINEFVYAFVKYEFLDSMRDFIKRGLFNEAYNLYVDYSSSHKELMKNILTHAEPMETVARILHNEIRTDVEDILRKKSAILNLSLPDKFYTFFSNSIMEEYMQVPKQMILDGVSPSLLKKLFPLYIDAIPDKLIKVSKINFNE